MKTIEELKAEYSELSLKLQQPDLSKNPVKFKEVSLRFSELSEIMQLSDELTKVTTQIEETKTLIDESDNELKEMAVEELENLTAKENNFRESLENLLVEKDPNDYRNALVEIRAGTGGDEASLFAGDLSRMYLRYAEKKGWRVEKLSSHETGTGGFKEAIYLFSGNNIYGNLKFENGVHRVQRVPATESAGRIHTSAASVVVLPEIEDVEVEVNQDDLKIDVYRSSGAGGQSVNTTDSAVRITHIPSGIVVTVQDERSQLKNKLKAMKILKSKLYEMKISEEEAKEGNKRKEVIQGGDRSVKIKTYNFPQSRVTDHRIKKSWYNLASILDGDLDEIISTTKKELNNK